MPLMPPSCCGCSCSCSCGETLVLRPRAPFDSWNGGAEVTPPLLLGCRRGGMEDLELRVLEAPDAGVATEPLLEGATAPYREDASTSPSAAVGALPLETEPSACRLPSATSCPEGKDEPSGPGTAASALGGALLALRSRAAPLAGDGDDKPFRLWVANSAPVGGGGGLRAGPTALAWAEDEAEAEPTAEEGGAGAGFSDGACGSSTWS
mmetsp:Transcript_82500/g.191681  ORF Transcript_82500/g.191681 Transcript_82500/m.191681 type:complete len:208 (-) Transcript_82500:306-929(-)